MSRMVQKRKRQMERGRHVEVPIEVNAASSM